MATVTRKRILVNPAKRRRKLSPKQIAIFGTKAQKSALKRSRSAKRSHRKRTNPKRHVARVKRAAPRVKHRPAVRRRRRARSNPGEIITLALNPATTRRKTVARKRRKNARRSHAHTHRRRTRRAVAANPAPRRRYSRRRRSVGTRRVRRNPSATGITSLLMKGGLVVGGGLGVRALTQAVLGSNNTGMIGYAGNLVATLVLGKVADMAKKGSGLYVMLGGAAAIVQRALTDAALGNLGSKLGMSGMGDYVMTQTIIPPTLKSGSWTQYANPFPAPAPAMVAARGGMSGLPIGQSALVRASR